MKKYIYLLFILHSSCASNFQLQEGDLLFQDLDSSALCDAIELVTPGYNDANFSHIGFIVSDDGKLKVLEAIPPKVILTELEDFLSRSKDKDGNPKVIVGRLKKEYEKTIPKAVEFAHKKIGVDYDGIFIMNNNSYYCSELLYEAFSKDTIFQLQAMTFLHPESGDTLQTWKAYYAELGVKIPENELGINPGIMSLSKKIEIVHIYGIPDGMN
ncbi:MAG: YiiX/YebB-like N1pC/P60 family cysteine hydrolase, partial [Bacteroidetes bacterium]|nr:YiiX/YebB-like N1pC/P60 family cysteine hydrolase [Bacteroidota bacterium]